MHTYQSTATATAMSRALLFRTCSTAALGLAAAALTMAAAPAPMSDAAKSSYLAAHMVDTSAWKVMFDRPHSAVAASRHLSSSLAGPGAGLTIPYWTTTVTSPLDHHTYDVSMVGSSPYALHPSNTNVTYLPTVLRIHVGGFVLDPTKPSTCDVQSPARRFFNSPLFRPTTFTSNGVNVSAIPGGTQLISAFQRANFWNAVKGTSFGVTLIPSRLAPIVVDWTPTNPKDKVVGVADDCGGTTPVALIDINEFDTELQAIGATYAKSNQIPITLADDVAIYVNNDPGQCCVLGYHNAISVTGGTQVYATGAYFDTTKAFGPHFSDTTIWSHELAELADDPFVQSIGGIPGGTASDLTPPWGHTGQVSHCQDNLEAGDPLTPDQAGGFPNYAVTGVGGFAYHYQDLPFYDWFYRTASGATGGKYSFVGNFTGVQGVCVF